QEIGLASYPVFTRKASTDVSFLACARLLLDNADVIYPQFATHNALSAEYVEEMAKDIATKKGIDPIRFEFQRLHGMGEALHDGLLERGHASRIYAPVGGHKELLPYLVRRLLENGANSSFVNQLFDPKAPIDEIIADPIAEISALDEKSNDAIPAPRDLFDGKRLSAVGFDETDTRTATRLEQAARLSADLSNFAAPVVAFDYDRASLPTREIRNPANTDELVATVSEANEPMVGLAVEHAAIAAGPWAATSPEEKSNVLTKAADLIEQRADDFFALAVKEAGKTLPDAIAEVREAVDFLRYYANQSSGLKGDPLGVVACISPWNFPLAIFLGQISAAIAAGSVVIAKPAEQTPLIAIAATRLLHEAGLPRGVLQLLTGDGESIGAPLVQHAGVDGVIFTGSTPVAQKINQSLRERSPNALLIAETGGINAMIIDSTALLEQAVKDVVASAFQSAGQRCSACRVVLVQDDIVDRFEAMLAGAMDELSLGDPALLSTDVGPLIDPDALDDAAGYVAEAKKQFRTVAAAEMPIAPKGHFLPPIAFGLDSLKDVKREVFAPVLHVIPFKAGALEATLADVNGLGFGLTMGLHTRVDDTMHLVAERARVGNLYVNRNQIGAVVGVQPFGGEGLSGTGPKAGGPHYLQAIRRHKSTGEEPIESPSVAFSETPTTLLSQRLSVLKQKLDSWRTRDDRSQLFFKAAAAAKHKRAKLASEILSRAATLAKTLEDAQALPGPTGEANTLTLKTRGIVLCLGVDEAALPEQLAKSLAAGNAIVTTEQLASDIAGFVAAGAGGDILPIFGTPIWDGTSHNLPLDIIQSPSVSGVAFDGR
ncbi:MAG: bifunctional proline dehydrogenase/L-glutamate gamma-semialdehyde dehydrogenase PutA, partial [Pseudomonadota bacterium]